VNHPVVIMGAYLKKVEDYHKDCQDQRKVDLDFDFDHCCLMMNCFDDDVISIHDEMNDEMNDVIEVDHKNHYQNNLNYQKEVVVLQEIENQREFVVLQEIENQREVVVLQEIENQREVVVREEIEEQKEVVDNRSHQVLQENQNLVRTDHPSVLKENLKEEEVEMKHHLENHCPLEMEYHY
jgi:hypothetical protein